MAIEIMTTPCAWRSTASSSRPRGSRLTAGWEVSHWPRFFDRNQAITALAVTELLESGRDSSDPVVKALREELR